ncbi:acyl-CoA carboxylase subunit epsilon [Gordonia crocea]|uniref:Acyl-CoA carboxylase subunit epsilon n=1 Tax=Gordonia crocea TaxID=589162 RepID=A0A7I9UWX5_9ACTN|nr:acyl-CoA carboxylase subunit epsilon [Gordonia crocea]GED97366.1 hypothetical protein nbrc107697_14050 [Gordonia crocea]
MSDAAKNDAEKKPLLTVVKGNPTATELAALTAVVVARASGGAGESRPAVRNDWGRPVDRLRRNWASPTSFYHELW